MTIYGHENDENVWKTINNNQKAPRPWEFAFFLTYGRESGSGGSWSNAIAHYNLHWDSWCCSRPFVLLQVIQGPMITLSFLNFISETLWKFQANSFHRSFLEGRCQVSSQALIPTLTQSTCNAAAALQKCEQVEQWKLIGCMSCGKWWKMWEMDGDYCMLFCMLFLF